ncbi:ATP-binding protein [Peterkaempfera griseoplana]|uniref:ATP-binding protein n=1 Tax=Peterkaempfera griseoplana TaxID=66896 RepID=UPI0007C67E8A|nr:ATP-binding protein [Peterkaempfera griseoplana]
MEDRVRTYELRLTAVPSRFEAVRRITAAHLRYWKFTSLVDSALLGVTELLANVHQHAAGGEECVLRLRAAPDCLTVSVHDADPTLPVAREAEVWEVSGRGLAIVAALSKEWGAQVEPDGCLAGKVVWFALSADPVRPEPLRAPQVRRILTRPRLTVDPLRPSAPLRTAPLVLPGGGLDDDEHRVPVRPGRARPVAVPLR